MYSKLIIKLYLLLFVVDLALRGLISSNPRMSIFSIINLVGLFVILIQERDIFQDMASSRRVLFTPDVFAFIALAVGLWGAWQVNNIEMFVGMHTWLVILFIGGLFYVLSAWIFTMYPKQHIGKILHIRLLTWILTAIFVYLMSSYMFGMIPGDKNTQTTQDRWNGFITSFRDVTNPEQNVIKKQNDDKIDLPQIAEVDENKNEDEELIDITDKRINRIFEQVNYGQDVPLTFGNFLPLLVRTYNLVRPTTVYTFTHVAADSDLYDAFATARAYTMIGSATRPEQVIQCRHLMVLLGLAEDRQLTYNADNVFDVYWDYAESKGYTAYGCEDPLEIATFAMLP